MNTQSALLLLRLMAEGVGVAKRVMAGEEITNAKLECKEELLQVLER